MGEGFDDYFRRYGDWPWKNARAFRQREMISLAMRGDG
jgi:hypothetical protein